MKGLIALGIGFGIGLAIDNSQGLGWENSSTLATSMAVWFLYLFIAHGNDGGGGGDWLGNNDHMGDM